MTMVIHRAARSRRKQDYVEFRIIWATTFPLFLVATFISRLVPRRGPARADRPEGLSLIEEAKAMADCALPFAYIG